MLHKTHQKLYSEGEEPRASSATPSLLILSSKFENSIAVHRKGIREQGRGRPSFTPPVQIKDSSYKELVGTGGSIPGKTKPFVHISGEKIEKLLFCVCVFFCFFFLSCMSYFFLSNLETFIIALLSEKGSGFGTQLSLRHQKRIFEPEVQIPHKRKLCYYCFVFFLDPFKTLHLSQWHCSLVIIPVSPEERF